MATTGAMPASAVGSPATGHKRKGLTVDLEDALTGTGGALPLQLGDVQQALRTEVQSFLGEIKTAMNQMEGRIADKLNDKLEGVHEQLGELKESYAEVRDGLRGTNLQLSSLEDRIATLEKQGGSSTTGGPSSMGGAAGRRRAIVIGGFHRDTPKDELIEGINKLVRQLDLDLNTVNMFATGIRRGSAIVPLEPKPDEGDREMTARYAGVLRKIRDANVNLGQRDDGGVRRLWGAFSQTLQQRQRSAFAGKVKRLVLSQSPGTGVECEWSSGTVWASGRRIASATTTPPFMGTVHNTKAGWIDLQALARILGKDEKDLGEAWEPLEGQPR